MPDMPVRRAVAEIPDFVTPFLGEQVQIFGHSYAAGSGLTGGGYAQKMAQTFGMLLNANTAVNGSTTPDMIKQIAGPGPMDQGVLVFDGPYNDAYQESRGAYSSARARASFVNGFRAMMDHLLRDNTTDGLILHSDTAQVVFTGTWSNSSSLTNMCTGTYKSTVTQNDSFTVSWTGDRVTLLMVGRDDSVNGTAGAAFTVAYNGSTVFTGTCSNQMVQSLINGFTVSHYPIRLTGYGPGYHTVTVTKTDSNGSMLGFDCALQPKASLIPTVLVMKNPPVPDPLPRSGQAAALLVYNALIDTDLTDSWYSGRPVVVVDYSAGWDTNADVNYDGIHPSPSGTRKILAAIARTAHALPDRRGLGAGTWTDAVTAAAAAIPAQITLPVSDNFTRANTVENLGALSTGGQQWRNETALGRFLIASNLAAPTGSGYMESTIETGRTDVTLTYTTSGATGISPAFRMVDNLHFLIWFSGTGELLATTGAGSMSGPTFGSAITPATGAATTWTAGDVLQVVLSGNSITCKKNGTTVATYTGVSTHNTGTRHGFASNGSSSARLSAFSIA